MGSFSVEYRLSMYASIDPDQGFVAALRTFRECGAERLYSDSTLLSIKAEFSGSPNDIRRYAECIAGVRGSCGADLRAVVGIGGLSVAIRCSFSRGPKQLYGREIAYRGIGGVHIVIEPAKAGKIYVARVYRVRLLTPPLQPSMYMIYSRLAELPKRISETLSLLEKGLLELRRCVEEAGV